jgi:hypothetical protein
MSTEQETAVLADGAQPVEPVEVTNDTLEAELNDATKSRDIKKIRAAREKIEKTAFGNKEPEIPEPVSAGDKPSSEKQKRVFKLKYNGEEVEIDDEDKFLGHKNFGSLKFAAAQSRVRSKKLEEQLAEAKRFAEDRNNQTVEYQQKYSNLEKELAAERKRAEDLLTKINQQVAPAPVASVPVQDVQIEIGDAPVYPEIPDDPTDWTSDDAKKDKAYKKELTEYNKKMREAITSLSKAKPAVVAQIPDDVKKKLEEFDSLKKDFDTRKQEIASEKATFEAKKKSKEYWDSLESFQKEHAEYKTNKPVEEKHKEILSWMDKIAEANGISKPLGATAEQASTYENAKNDIVYKFLHNDEQVVANANGVEHPEDYQQYFQLAELVKKRNEYIQSGELGNAASLDSAFALMMHKEGRLTDSVNSLATDERSKGAKAVLDSIRNVDATYARTIPNSAPKAGTDTNEMTLQEAIALVTQAQTDKGMKEIKLNPELNKRYEAAKFKLQTS